MGKRNDFGLSDWLSPKKPLYSQLLEYYDWCFNVKGDTKATKEQKLGVIKRFCKSTEISSVEEITNAMIEHWMAEFRNPSDKDRLPIRGRTINTYFYTVRAMISWMKGCDYKIPGVKTAKLCPTKMEPARRHFYSEEQIAEVLTFADRREWLMIKLAFDCGFRCSELRNLKLSNITELCDGRYIEIIGKGRKQRPCIMSELTKQRLDDWIKRENITDYIFPNKRRTGALDDSSFREAMKKPFKKAGHPEFTPHDLRRSYATDCKLKGATDEEIRDGLGHSDVRITQIYLKQTYDNSAVSLYEKKYKNSTVEYR